MDTVGHIRMFKDTVQNPREKTERQRFYKTTQYDITLLAVLTQY